MKFLTGHFSLALLVLVTAMLAGCGAVPLTGRRQLLLVSDQEVFEAGLTQYKEYVSTAVMSGNADATAVVKSVGIRMAAAVEQYLKATGYESELANFA